MAEYRAFRGLRSQHPFEIGVPPEALQTLQYIQSDVVRCDVAQQHALLRPVADKGLPQRECLLPEWLYRLCDAADGAPIVRLHRIPAASAEIGCRLTVEAVADAAARLPAQDNSISPLNIKEQLVSHAVSQGGLVPIRCSSSNRIRVHRVCTVRPLSGDRESASIHQVYGRVDSQSTVQLVSALQPVSAATPFAVDDVFERLLRATGFDAAVRTLLDFADRCLSANAIVAASAARQLGVGVSRGALVCGPVGSGKSTLLRLLEHQLSAARINVVRCAASSLLNTEPSDSSSDSDTEQADHGTAALSSPADYTDDALNQSSLLLEHLNGPIGNLLGRLRAASPCVLLLEDLHLLAPRMGGSKGMDRYVSASAHEDNRDEAVDASRQALNQLHPLLKRVGSADPNLKACVIATVSDLDRLDESLIGHGKLQPLITLSTPNLGAREALLNLVLQCVFGWDDVSEQAGSGVDQVADAPRACSTAPPLCGCGRPVKPAGASSSQLRWVDELMFSNAFRTMRAMHSLWLKGPVTPATISARQPAIDTGRVCEACSILITTVSQQMAQLSLGYLPADLVAVCERAVFTSPIAPPRQLSSALGKVGVITVAPAHLLSCTTPVDRHRSVDFVADRPLSTWADVAGYANEKHRLQTIIRQWKAPSVLNRLGLSASKGILLHGPSGCGKTLLARAMGHESEMSFIAVNGSDLFSKWLGDSEKMVRRLFAQAKQSRPCIIFFDELDVIGAKRAGGDGHSGSSADGGAAGAKGSGVEERILSTLLNEMDGIDSAQGVFVLAATNRLQALDAALTRPGRLDTVLEVPLPDASSRDAVLTSTLARMRAAPSMDIAELIDRTMGLSCAHLQQLCFEAARLALKPVLSVRSSTQDGAAPSLPYITLEYLLQAAAVISRDGVSSRSTVRSSGVASFASFETQAADMKSAKKLQRQLQQVSTTDPSASAAFSPATELHKTAAPSLASVGDTPFGAGMLGAGGFSIGL